MTTAADALVRDCANRLDQLFRQDYTMREVEAELRRLLRAALAQPQAGEVEPRKVMQTEFGVDGNCQSACIATITGIPLDAIPNFTKLGKTDLQRRQAMCEWLWAHGWGIVTFVASDTEIRRWYPGFVIAGGESARGIYHGVVYKDGELWHDPHPDGTGLTKVEDCDILYRLLRATQSNGRLAVDGRGSFPGEGSTPSQSRYPKAGSTPAGGESPAQSAPAQEPVAWAWFHRGQVNFDGSDALRELDDLKATPIPLYAAPQQDEAVALLREVVRRYDDYRGKGVMPAPGEYQMVVGAIERIRAFLKDRT